MCGIKYTLDVSYKYTVCFSWGNNADNYFQIQRHLTLLQTTALSCTVRRSCHFEPNVFSKKIICFDGKSPLLGEITIVMKHGMVDFNIKDNI